MPIGITSLAQETSNLAEVVRLELTRPFLDPRFSRALPLDRLGLHFHNMESSEGIEPPSIAVAAQGLTTGLTRHKDLRLFPAP